MEGNERELMLACVISGTLFSLLAFASFALLWAVNWRPCWIFARKWPGFLQGPQLGIICSFLSLSAWIIVIFPVVVLVTWGCWLMLILGRDIVGLAVIMAGSSLLLEFYSIMLRWRTQWQSSRAVAVLLLLAVGLLCAYELCAVYVKAGVRAHLKDTHHQGSSLMYRQSPLQSICYLFAGWSSMVCYDVA